MKTMAAAFAALLPLIATARTDVYSLTLTLRVPRVYSNAESLGYRRYQRQTIRGTMRVRHADGEPDIEIGPLVNRTHLVAKERVSYRCEVTGVAWHAIGSNRTGRFRTASVRFDLDADPSYNVGADEPDNTIVLTLSGSGTSDRTLSGYAAGQIGCGCYAYGHVSPTRIYGTGTVVDTAAAWGTWKAVKTGTED